MSLLGSLRTLMDFLFRRSRVEREMEEELRSHLRSRAAVVKILAARCADSERVLWWEWSAWNLRCAAAANRAGGGKGRSPRCAASRCGL